VSTTTFEDAVTSYVTERPDGTTFFSFAVAEGVTAEFDGVCFADIRYTDRVGNLVSLSVYRNELPNLIAALVKAYGEAEAHRGARDGE